MQSEAPTYSRIEREGPVPASVKLNQAIGAIPDTVKNWVFNTFVLLYYNQVLGLDARWVSIALAVAIVFDAITDPLVASISDNLKGKWGRRHPLMFISAVPLGICAYCVFAPPENFSEMALFTWLMTFVLLTRGFMTLFFVPWASIAAELSDDYTERTSIMSYRYAIGWTIGVSLPVIVYTFIFPSTDTHPVGQLNPAGYEILGLVAGGLMISAVLATTWLTRNQIPFC